MFDPQAANPPLGPSLPSGACPVPRLYGDFLFVAVKVPNRYQLVRITLSSKQAHPTLRLIDLTPTGDRLGCAVSNAVDMPLPDVCHTSEILGAHPWNSSHLILTCCDRVHPHGQLGGVWLSA